MSVRMGVSGSGYATVHDRDTGEWVYVHRLACVAEYGFDAVLHMDVHHNDETVENNGVRNLTPMDPAEHRKHNLAL